MQTPLLMYTANDYLSRVIKTIVERSPIRLLGQHVVESDLTSLTADFAAKGLGMGWLPDSLLSSTYSDELVAVERADLSATLHIVAYVSRKKRSNACDYIWQKITA